jgi:hypothetical protein
MKHNLIENNIIILSKQTLDEFLKEDAPADLIALYCFYYYTAKWQETNQPKASVQYCATGLHWGKDKVIKTKKRLEEIGLISDVRVVDETTKQVKAWYVKLNYIWKQETHIPQSQRVAKPESGFQEGNALSANKLNALSANKKLATPARCDVQPYFVFFKEVNPSWERLYSNKTERAALVRLVEKYGADTISKWARALPKIISQPYSPQITTPYELERKLGQLMSFLQRKQSEKPISAKL